MIIVNCASDNVPTFGVPLPFVDQGGSLGVHEEIGLRFDHLYDRGVVEPELRSAPQFCGAGFSDPFWTLET